MGLKVPCCYPVLVCLVTSPHPESPHQHKLRCGYKGLQKGDSICFVSSMKLQKNGL